MSDKSRIEWTDASWNPVTGCSKVSQGCKNCYAERDWARLTAPRTPPNIYTGRDFTDVRCHPERLDQPLRWRKPRRIFVNSMSDLFHKDVPDEFIDQVFVVMVRARHHVFQVLTKRPARMLDYLTRFKPDSEGFVTRGGRRAMGKLGNGPIFNSSRWPPPHVWLGVSVEDQATADERIPLLLQTPAAVRWVSAEPLLEQIDLTKLGNSYVRRNALTGFLDAGPATLMRDALPRLDWVVAGGESGPKARPMHPDLARSLRGQCQAAGVSFFFKQYSTYCCENSAEARAKLKARGRLLDGRTWDEYPDGTNA